ncbi:MULTISPECIES: MauE/DoxX family redox-associated membrane protein [Bacillus]|uniref:MauE/DoxX family redox-associated membrane protein n=2 Tax=Bacillaceae TaxID=186817 RepID=UPI00079FF0D3|nr:MULTISPECIES: MauE/DoxX family redox-associated membrane protein [Bacillus]MBE3642514.1 methylase [Bacillus anthracis]MDA1738982.1 methylase [Bacillus cereus]KYZ67410.1 methylase [Bacillus sp. GZT]MDA2120845.1 methylase [Bacillus cereus]MDA2311888.1 methylase [Bacillus cereus]
MISLLFIMKIGLATLFISTGIDKIKKFNIHLLIIKEYQIIPENQIRLFTIIEIFAELFISICLFIGLFHTFTLICAVLLLLVYSVAISINLLRGRKEISCGCGGVLGNHKLSWMLVVRNLFIGAVSVILLMYPLSLGSLDQALKTNQFVLDTFNFQYFILVFTSWIIILIGRNIIQLYNISLRIDRLTKK